MFDAIQCGDRVTIKTPHGNEYAGRAFFSGGSRPAVDGGRLP